MWSSVSELKVKMSEQKANPKVGPKTFGYTSAISEQAKLTLTVYSHLVPNTLL